MKNDTKNNAVRPGHKVNKTWAFPIDDESVRFGVESDVGVGHITTSIEHVPDLILVLTQLLEGRRS